MKKLNHRLKAWLRHRAHREARVKTLRKIKRTGHARRVEAQSHARRSFAKKNNVLPISDVEIDQIILPARVSLFENSDAVADILSRVRRSVFSLHRKAILHFEHVEFIDAPTALALVAEIFRCNNLRKFQSGRAVNGTFPKSAEVHKQLCDLGFYNLLDVQHAPLDDEHVGERTLFLKFLTGNQVFAAEIAEFIDIVDRHGVLRLNDVAKRRLQEALVEAMGNATEHAYGQDPPFPAMSNRWWMSASLDRMKHELSVSLYDQGIGIPNTIHLSMFDPVALREILPTLFNQSVDGSRIAAATELFRTGTRQSGRGKGFRNMKELVEVADNGEMRVLSNRGYYHYVSHGSGTKAIESHGDHSLSIEGTLIEWRIRHAHQVVLEDE